MPKIILTNPGPHHIIGKPLNKLNIKAGGVYRLKEGELEKRFNIKDWNVIIGKQIAKRTEYEVECWLYDKHLKKEKTLTDGQIKYRIFPCSFFFHRRSFSAQFLNALKKEVEAALEAKKKTGQNELIIHLNDYHTYQAYLILRHFGGKVPIVAQYHGVGPPFDTLINRPYLFPTAPLLWVESSVEKRLLKKVDAFLTTAYEREYLKRIVPERKINVLPTPADYELCVPADKKAAKKKLAKLGIKPNSKVMIYIGFFFKLKRADLVVKAMRELRCEMPDSDVQAIMIGGNPKDDLYKFVKNSGAIAIDRVAHEELVDYYNASDVFVYFASESMKKHAGMGVAPAEALACNVPLVSTNIQNMPISDIKKVGFVPKNEKDFVRKIKYVFEHPEKFRECRKIGEKYFSYDAVYGNYVRIYRELIKK